MPDPDRLAALEAEIVAAPGDGVKVADYLEVLTRAVGSRAAVERLAAFQERAGTPLAATLYRLEQTYKNEVLRQRFADLLARAAAEPYFVACERIWRDHLHGRPLDPADCAIVKTDKTRASSVYFSFIAAPVRQYAAANPKAPPTAAAKAACIDLPRLQGAIQAFTRFGSRQWQDVVCGAKHADDAVAAEVIFKERYSSSKDRVIAERRLRFIDPYSGAWIEPYDSFIFSGKAIYAFAGRHRFYLIYAYLGIEPCGLYLPAHDLMLSLTPQLRGALAGEQIANIRAAILRRMARMPDAYHAAATARPSTRMKEIVLVVGRTENFAHHVWNFYAALERITLTGACRNVDLLITGGTQFFGPIPELFPEFRRTPCEHNPRNYADPRPFQPESLVVPTGGNYVPASLSRRIVEAMRRRPGSAQAVEPGDVEIAGPVVWFGMRLGDKSWVDQETGIPTIIRAIADRYPDALFLLDGFSFPVGADQISQSWADVIAELDRVAQAIRTASPDPSRVLNLVGNTLRENVLWADATDVYLAPLGSTQHKVAWFTDAPGVVYAPPMYADGKAERTVGNWAVEISGPIDWLIGQPAGPGKRRGARDTRTRMQNVELDSHDLARRMLAMLEDRPARPGWCRSEPDGGAEPPRPAGADDAGRAVAVAAP